MDDADGPAAAGRLTAARRLRVTGLACTFVTTVLAAGWLVSRDHVVMSGLRARLGVPGSTGLRSPAGNAGEAPGVPVGTTLRDCPVRARIAAAAGMPRTGYLLAVLGTCGGCTRFEAGPWRSAAARHGLAMVGVTELSRAATARYARHARPGIPLVADPEGLLVGWLGRPGQGEVLVFDRRWRLVWRTDAAAHGPTTAEQVRALERWLEANR